MIKDKQQKEKKKSDLLKITQKSVCVCECECMFVCKLLLDHHKLSNQCLNTSTS